LSLSRQVESAVLSEIVLYRNEIELTITLETNRSITIGKEIVAMMVEAVIASLPRDGCGRPTQISSCVITVETNEGH